MISEQELKEIELDAKSWTVDPHIDLIETRQAKAILKLLLALRESQEMVKELCKIIRIQEDSMAWIMPKVHQGNHSGEFGVCEKATCSEYHKAITQAWKLREALPEEKPE